MIHPWHDVSPTSKVGELPGYFQAVVEIPKGSNLKYELDKGSGMLRLDRVLSSAVYYPANYGFIPQTLAEDDDPLDVLVYCTEEIPPATICDARVVGMMTMIDQGQPDHKIIAVLCQDPIYNDFPTAGAFPRHIFKLLRRFFEDYKALENKQVAVDDILPVEAAHAIIEDSLARYWKSRRKGDIKGLKS
ncbi:MAG: inorganic diphosphatase [Planctomycetaceae bacterium]|jgi:inorganic pyrophosphatase|nr:inorganic diphosphatase [Phycisphaerales bacterium]MCE2653355.1 inorganic diphosphatase [Planctomycetaceae bacterium]